MKKILLSSLLICHAFAFALSAEHDECGYCGEMYNANEEIPTLIFDEEDAEDPNWEKISCVAQYGLSDWSHALFKVHNISLKEAKEIAEKHSEVTYFFYMNDYMFLGDDPSTYRFFSPRDAVFFSGTPWWGTAPQANGYIKKL